MIPYSLLRFFRPKREEKSRLPEDLRVPEGVRCLSCKGELVRGPVSGFSVGVKCLSCGEYFTLTGKILERASPSWRW